ncbi:LOW QUALITY PROTEIN: uncharacterized protein C20orf202 homolog [Sorex fumeus]|uniref:LOW QUALITY PROTEIN: uncharacterized protein C20orf202 homolog n=1 Tax=Sorex fumeus TaxID=62283 RepID=UPI0024AE69B9|nr:LOW QUALITY PROTEIN: uncharacterized protein C20orf202 homolog [Sorex fumeus]
MEDFWALDRLGTAALQYRRACPRPSETDEHKYVFTMLPGNVAMIKNDTPPPPPLLLPQEEACVIFPGLSQHLFPPEVKLRFKSKVPLAHHQVKVSPKDMEMKTTDASDPDLQQMLSWLRKELAEMQEQDRRLLLTLGHLQHVLKALRTESARWEDARGGASPIRARAGSDGKARRSISSRESAQLLSGADSRRSSLP